MQLNWIDVIQAPLGDLTLWQQIGAEFETPWIQTYAEVIALYLKGENDRLAELTATLNAEQPGSFLAAISRLRLAIRQRQVTLDLIVQTVATVSELMDPSLFEGEVLFCAGYACTTIDRFDLAAAYYEKAVAKLMKLGAKKKALKAALNRLAAMSSVDPNQNLIAEYQSVYHEAKRTKDLVTAGLCLMNISREYQRLSALRAALYFGRLSVTCMQVDAGTVHYALAQVHLAHVLYQTGSTEEADLFYDMAAASADFPEIKSALKILHSLRHRTAVPEDRSGANMTWEDRRINADSEMAREVFSEMENKLLRLLRSGSKSKAELIEQLYGTAADYESLENRLKNLLFRIRKRSPALIKFKNDQYVLSKIDVVVKRA